MKTSEQLLTREEFKRQVFAVTNGKCCVPGCTCNAVDAHHIMDRKLWSDGGYYLKNGAALCAEHHLQAERGETTPKQCYDYMTMARVGLDNCNMAWIKPDKLDWLTQKEFQYCILHNIIDKWGK
jgi:hypothetical protein